MNHEELESNGLSALPSPSRARSDTVLSTATFPNLQITSDDKQQKCKKNTLIESSFSLIYNFL
jgi:hypothetical protein